ncbi:MAG: DUF2157 domain-containing protein [Leptolyngbya sp. SIO4C5]|nr:DUF2157 domain-containing protein [Leptolyngbya sp. SIO4C5]
MASEKFRQQLAQELPQWQQDGLISDEQQQQIADRYRLNQLESSAQNRFTAILIGLGSVLLGIGAITFVAANWQAIPRDLKLLLLITAFLSINIAGFELWYRAEPETGQRRLGQGLLLLGALLLGANLALTGQLFHRSGSFYDLCLAWSLGIWLMAYSLQITVLGVLAALILIFGYGSGLWGSVWQNAIQWGWTLEAMPLIAGGLFIPLAYRCRSKVIFALGAIAVGGSYWTILLQLANGISPVLTLCLFLVPYALLWAYRDRLWPIVNANAAFEEPFFQPVARRLSVFGLGSLYYIGAFYFVWSQPASPDSRPVDWSILGRYGLGSLAIGIVLVCTVWAWIALGQRDRPSPTWRWTGLDATIAFFLLMTAAIPYIHWFVSPMSAIATLVFNLLLFLIAVGCIQQGLHRARRDAFWFGTVLLTLQVLSRVFEYETGLLLKSIAFGLCGILVILAGLWFERYLRRLSARRVSGHE